MTTISVVIPAYNDAEMLRRCLRALSEQIREADEVIVVDNASTDDTAAVARAAGATLLSEPVQGIWPAASRGYDAARGDIIARLDADSIPPADWTMHLEAEFTADPGTAVITGPGDFYDGSAIAVFLGKYLYIGGYFWSMSIWLDHSPIFGSNFAMRREVWEQARGTVHRDMRAVHDDLDLSFALQPGDVVLYDPTLRVGISGRPFSSWRGFGRRLHWAYLTLRMHWPQDSPWRRRQARKALVENGDDATAWS
ncbi:glycosyltransferase family A protein [Compostimonas suwonensis]|uniref:4,4'-diaponeurosporenoate glycosyltransferase n=1 Tax=Compostimonas suwonensis TaxID=1048394 RepID=A0A2M9BU09_9MICO|nr:glycosyltransferase family A protein [Compostimonas suwonensis]PJJ61402.1 glycosyl transferase family 2 [Compostimonas suwonensis]